RTSHRNRQRTRRKYSLRLGMGAAEILADLPQRNAGQIGTTVVRCGGQKRKTRMRQLYHTHLSPFCRKARMLLKEKNLEFELVCENPWDKNLEFFALNPAGEVPVLVEEDGTVISGAYAISEYVEEKYPSPTLIGASAAERAEVRRLCDWFDHKFDYEVTQ